MTQEQRLHRRCERTYEIIVDQLEDAIKKNGFTADSVAGFLGVSRSTVRKMLKGDPVTLNSIKWCRLLELCGLEIKPKGGEQNGNV